MENLLLSQSIENLLVAKNLRGMKDAQAALIPGYYWRAAELINQSCTKQHTILIGTGFPVGNTFETDGPLGAIALYNVIKQLGGDPIIVCGSPLSTVLAKDFQVFNISAGVLDDYKAEAEYALNTLKPKLIISIERPGLSYQGHYFNMHGENINDHCACFDSFFQLADCPTIGIGDGGNEIGMGNITEAIRRLDIIPATTTCDELLIADVSNWAAHGVIALLSKWHQHDFLQEINTVDLLNYLSQRNSLDGITRLNTLTEDGLPASEGEALINSLRQLTGFAIN